MLVLEVQGVLVEEGVVELEEELVEETLVVVEVVEVAELVVGSGVSSPPSTS